MNREIEDLSKDELLGLIYHILPDTQIKAHPCECAVCGDRYTHGSTAIVLHDDGLIDEVVPYWYVCDKCEALFDEEDRR